MREKVNYNKKDHWFGPRPGQSLKKSSSVFFIFRSVSDGAVAQAIEHPSKGPWSQCYSTDVGSKHAAAKGGRKNPNNAICCSRCKGRCSEKKSLAQLVQLLFDPHSNSFSSQLQKKVPMWSWSRMAASESVAHPLYSMQSLWVMLR